MENGIVQQALLNYRNTRKSEQLGSPNQRLMSRVTRSTIPTTKSQLEPKLMNGIPEAIEKARQLQESHHDKHSKHTASPKVSDMVRMQRIHRG